SNGTSIDVQTTGADAQPLLIALEDLLIDRFGEGT
ncbi:MAG: phosphotransferase system HPr-like phosphotransfer protein, partial [Planctomycetota bacterium]